MANTRKGSTVTEMKKSTTITITIRLEAPEILQEGPKCDHTERFLMGYSPGTV